MICFVFKWFVSQAPYLIHEHTKAPHITGRGVLLVVKCLLIILFYMLQVDTLLLYIKQERNLMHKNYEIEIV